MASQSCWHRHVRVFAAPCQRSARSDARSLHGVPQYVVPSRRHRSRGFWTDSIPLHLKLGGAAAACFALSENSTQTMCLEPKSSKDKDASRQATHGHSRLVPKDLEPLLEPTPDNPIPVSMPPPMPGLTAHQWCRHRHVAPILGLPMRGKKYMAHSLKRYIEFFHGARAHVFDINSYIGAGGDEKLEADLIAFFEASDDEGWDDWEELDIAGKYSGGFAIICSSDTVESTESRWSAHTKKNRRWMAKILQSQLSAETCFIQVSVDAENKDAVMYMEKLAEARGKTMEEVQSMIADYTDHYVPIQTDGSESSTPYINLINYNQAMVVNRMMQTFVGSRVCQYLANSHPYSHTVFLSRHGESEYNVEKRLGGDSSLSPRGVEYARRVGEFSKFVVAGRCTNLVCVTLLREELLSLSEHIAENPLWAGRGLYTKGDWTGYGDTSGATVVNGMQLVRIQPGYGKDFEDAPSTLAEVLNIAGAGLATLVFVEGDLTEAGEVPARLWTSSLRRTIETAGFVPHPVLPTTPKPYHQMLRRTHRSLDEVYAGEYDGLTEEEIKRRFPQVIEDRKLDKLGFRYPRGESYYDIIARLDDVMTQLERVREPILIISHQAVLRMIRGWMKEITREASIKLTFPQHCIEKIDFDGHSAARRYTVFPLGPKKLCDDGQGNF